MSNPVHFQPFGGHHSWDTVRSSIEHGTLWWKPVQLDFWQKSPAWLALNGWMRKNTLGLDFLSTRSALTWSNQHCRVIFRDDCQRIVQAHSFCWVASTKVTVTYGDTLCTHALKGSNPSSNCNRCPRVDVVNSALYPRYSLQSGLYTGNLYLVQATIKWWIYRLHRRSTQYKVGTVTNYKWSELGPLEVGWNDASCRCSHL